MTDHSTTDPTVEPRARHRPDYIVCTCGAQVMWGRFDAHAHKATMADALGELRKRVRGGR